MASAGTGAVWCRAICLGAAVLGAGTLLSACGSHPAYSPLGQVSELPVTRVVLYQNGVGYFERTGSVDGSALTLQVNPSQINDLLKSLTVIDSGSGRAVSASLPLEQSADRLLSELPEQVRRAGGLLSVLRLFRGAHVEIAGDAGHRVSGRVIGVENLEPGTAEAPADWRVSLKTADDEVVVYPVNKIRSVLLHDRTLSVGLERSLDVSLGQGGWKPIGLSVRLAGPSPHRVLISYIIEMPRWKPAYRLVLKDGTEPLLQGWAVVDNVSGEHWHDVSLSLVSGTPISFKYNLHAPQYTERADLTPVGLPRAAAPPPGESAGYDEDLAEEPDADDARGDYAPGSAPAPARLSKKRSRPEGAAWGASKSGAMPMEAEMSVAPPPAPAPSLQALQSQGGQAESSVVGALFRYDVRDRVTIPDRSSTLVNIINQRIVGEQVVYFRPELSSSQRDTHPYRAVKFDNSTGFTLEKGPITVYSDGTFVGEGFVERMEDGQTSFLTFAIDGKVFLDQKGGTREEGLELVRIVHGQMVTEARRVQHTTYEVKNRRPEAVRAYIRSLKTPGWTLKNRPEGSVDTPDAVIVPLDVPATASATLEVAWEEPITRTIAIDSSSARQLLRVYLKGGKAPPAVARVLEQVLSVQEQLDDKRKERQRVETDHAALSRDSQRVRDNLNVLRKTTGNEALQRDLARKLAALESQLGQLSGARVTLSEAIAELDKQLTQLVKAVTLEPK